MHASKIGNFHVKQNRNVIPNLIQYVYVISLWNAPKLKFFMIWSLHKNSNKSSNVERYLHFDFMIWIHGSMELYNNMHIIVIMTTLDILYLSNFVVSRIWQNNSKLFQHAYKSNHNNTKYIITLQFCGIKNLTKFS
jgi:hypothetical protein